jgi:hypothetical protein
MLAEKWHVVFPTDRHSDAPDLRLHHLHCRFVALASDQAFARGWHELSMFGEEASVRGKEEAGAI